MYDHLSRFPWLLRGDATAKRFADFSSVEGELFVSGDYESATDNLNQQTQKEVLRLILQQCRVVPVGIQLSAMNSLSVDLTFLDEVGQPQLVKQRSGQMMGHLLSFPLLCFVNYLCFKYLIPENIPVKINGDDIVFRGSPEQYKRWSEGVSRAGLTLSVGKTLVDPRFFTLNSTLFRANSRSVVLVPVVRSSALFGVGQDRLASLTGRYKSFTYGFFGQRRRSARSFFLRENRRFILASRRSVSRGLGMRVCRDSLIRSGLWDRECSYLSLPMEKPLASIKSCWSVPPEGYHLVSTGSITKEMNRASKGVSAAFVAAAWKRGKEVDNDLKGDIWCGTSCVFRSSIGRKMLGISANNTRRMLERANRRIFESSILFSRKSIWMPDGRPLSFRGSEGNKVIIKREKPLRPSTFETDDPDSVQCTLSWVDPEGDLCHFSGLVRSEPPPNYSDPMGPFPPFEVPDPDEKRSLLKRFCRLCGDRYTVSFSHCQCGFN
jgi:hypothetical protein